MDQIEFPLMGRLDAPSVAPQQWVKAAKNYREAVRLSWRLRRVAYMTRQQLAAEADLYPQHVTDYLHEDDAPTRRSLPPQRIEEFEDLMGNTAISQWIAGRARLTVLEELQAERHAA
jgi:hypothetical protein